jgi:two-component response regulator (ARR-A family)
MPELPHILAVDDSIVDRAVISRLLRSSKYRGVHSTFRFLDQ